MMMMVMIKFATAVTFWHMSSRERRSLSNLRGHSAHFDHSATVPIVSLCLCQTQKLQFSPGQSLHCQTSWTILSFYWSWWYIISGFQEAFALQPNMNLIHTCTWESFVNTRNSIHKSTQFLLERPKHLLVYPGFCLGVGIVSWFFGGCLAMAYQAVREGGRVLNITSKVSHQLRSTHAACLKGTTWQFKYKHCKMSKPSHLTMKTVWIPVLSVLELEKNRLLL